MIAQAFVAGGATLVVALVLFQLWLKTPPRSVCPCCGEPTATVSHPLLALAARWVRLRWCAACGWQGWGRNGPVLSRRRGPVSDGSGFRWGPERLPIDFGFRWAGHSATAAPAAPAHPSGFRWASALDTPETGGAETAPRLSAFHFRAPTDEVVAAAAHPSGFRWAGSLSASAPSGQAVPAFRWKS